MRLAYRFLFRPKNSMPLGPSADLFGGSPGPRTYCGWYCELSWARRPGLWTDGVRFFATPTIVSVVLCYEANDARLVIDIAPELPDVAVDLRQIGHVFSNLVSNAARHSKPGEDVVLSAKPIGKIVRFSVLDHGPGIPKEFQSRIFERFFRIPGTEDSTGVGLGLAIAREMIVSHGGSIGLQSTSGKGSEFYFDLPATSSVVKA